MTHICVSKLSIIGSDNGLAPDRRQAIIWTNAGILLIGTLGTNFNEILIEIQTFSFKNIHLKMSSGKWRPFYLGLNVLKRMAYASIDMVNQVAPMLLSMFFSSTDGSWTPPWHMEYLPPYGPDGAVLCLTYLFSVCCKSEHWKCCDF